MKEYKVSWANIQAEKRSETGILYAVAFIIMVVWLVYCMFVLYV